MISLYILFALFILFYINKMTNNLCLTKEKFQRKNSLKSFIRLMFS